MAQKFFAKKRLFLTGCLLLFLILLPIIFLNHFWSNIFISTANSQDVAFQTSQALDDRFVKGEPLSILLLGYGGGSHEGAYLTDSILDVIIDPSHHQTTLISIPRDIWLSFPNSFNIGDHWKVNASYAIGLNDKDFPDKPSEYRGQKGGINLAKYAVSEITGIPVDRVVLVDFAGFVKGVDLLRGIDVTIDKTFDDYAYPIDGKEDDPCGKSKSELDALKGVEIANPEQVFPCRYEHLHFDKGIAHLDGESALKLARSRHSTQDGTDFQRSSRQRNILVAIKNKMLTPTILPKIFQLSDIVAGHVHTDLTLPEAGRF